jgi:hypothetical protein
MKTLMIYGASDDLIETSGIEGCDEFSAGGGDPLCGRLTVTADTDTLTIYCLYDGCWSFAISPWPNEEKLPWEIRRIWGNKQPYSETLEIDVPDNARLSYYKA